MNTANIIRSLREEEFFAAIDLVFAAYVLRCAGAAERGDGEAANLLFLGSALASRCVRDGDSCVAIDKLTICGENAVTMPSASVFLAALRRPEWAHVLTCVTPDSPMPRTLLVLDQCHRLYMQRYFSYEEEVARRINIMRSFPETELCIDTDYLRAICPRFRGDAGEVNYQLLAVLAAEANHFCVISGGPGTGKTTVSTALIALELLLHPDWRIMLCAPTGKAQARLQQAVREGVDLLQVRESLKEHICRLPCATVHSLLKYNGDTFGYCRENQLPCDLLIVDECSMLSLGLTAHLLEALPPSCRLVLLGDKNQLAAVETGAVLRDICECMEPNTVSAPFHAQFAPSLPVRESLKSGVVMELQKNHRFSSAPMIGEISAAIRNCGRDAASCAGLAERIALLSSVDFRCRNVGQSEQSAALDEFLIRSSWHLLPELAAQGTAEALHEAMRLLDDFRVLCASYHGAFGVEAFNTLIGRKLRLEGFVPGVPVMICENSARQKLFNGDIGIIWRRPGEGICRVFFPHIAEPFFLSALPRFERVFAMTVHKSQGSGFRDVLFALPEESSALLSHELLYTAVTRAVSYVEIWGDAPRLAEALSRRTARVSGLSGRLGEKESS